MLRFVLSILLYCLLLPFLARAQQPAYNPVFNDEFVPRITILIDDASLTQILNPSNANSDEEFPATFIFSSPELTDTLTNIGFRLRGNTSRVSQKKSFKVSFNSFEKGRKFQGLEKLNLNGEHNDPSVIRSKLSWDLFQAMGLPASRANHVELYINEEYRGLYINVEHLDEQFLQSRFGNDAGNLYKCLYPADLTYRGPNGSDYNFFSGDRRTYDLKLRDTDEGAYDDLARFIDVVNNSDDQTFEANLESIFDVNRYLQILAIEVMTGSWDGYWYLKNNYYLYFNPESARFHFIPFDYDNTFGIDFLRQDWGERNIYSWGHPSEPRPLTNRILASEIFRDRFSYYLQQLLDQEFSTEKLIPRVDQLMNMITGSAVGDVFRTRDYGFSIDDFFDSYTEALGGHVEYGLKPFIETRINATQQQLDQDVDVRPIIDVLSLRVQPARPAPSDATLLQVAIEDESSELDVLVEYRLEEQDWQVTALKDDGLDGDEVAGDGIYAGWIPALEESGTLSYIISASDDSRQTSFARTQSIEIGFPQIGLRINEFMPSNTSTFADEANEFDDWLEIYNGENNPVSLAGKFLTDNLSIPDKWALPDITLEAGEFLLIWVDGQPEQGQLHAPFRLSANGEEIGLFGEDETSIFPIDTLSFGPLTSDLAFARTLDGTGDFTSTDQPTPGSSNQTSTSVEHELPVLTALETPYPNPFKHQTTISIKNTSAQPVRLEVFDTLGRKVSTVWDNWLAQGSHDFSWPDDHSNKNLPAGIYFIRLQTLSDNNTTLRKVIRLTQ